MDDLGQDAACEARFKLMSYTIAGLKCDAEWPNLAPMGVAEWWRVSFSYMYLVKWKHELTFGCDIII